MRPSSISLPKEPRHAACRATRGPERRGQTGREGDAGPPTPSLPVPAPATAGRPAGAQPRPGFTLQRAGRRETLLSSSALVLGGLGSEFGGADAGTVINSVLGAYGLPKLAPAASGLKVLDEFSLAYTLSYPNGWIVRPNALRPGLYISDFQTADKLSTEEFTDDRFESQEQFLRKCMQVLILPQSAASGDAKLELPPLRAVRGIREEESDGVKYLYFSFPTTTTTRSGYEVQRRNQAVAACKKGRCYVAGVSISSDQDSKDKKALTEKVVASFRLR